jgi:hypothetical protein
MLTRSSHGANPNLAASVKTAMTIAADEAVPRRRSHLAEAETPRANK